MAWPRWRGRHVASDRPWLARPGAGTGARNPGRKDVGPGVGEDVATPHGGAVSRLGYRLIGWELGLSKNTVAAIVERNRTDVHRPVPEEP